MFLEPWREVAPLRTLFRFLMLQYHNNIFFFACFQQIYRTPSHSNAILFSSADISNIQICVYCKDHLFVYLTLSILFWFICHDYTEIFETVKSNF